MPPSRRAAEARLTAAWARRGPLACALWPLSLVFGLLAALRRALYRYGLLSTARLPVPVVVVGNLSVGGVGKTPAVIALIAALRAGGRHPGVVARGYRGAGEGVAGLVVPSSEASQCGDEPLLIARRCAVPVAVGADRVAAARLLLARHPEIDVILSDDGLQHYRLPRAVELVLCDARGFQNGWLLPAGPLREPLTRLAQVDALIVNAGADLGAVPPAPCFRGPRFAMALRPGCAWSLGRTAATETRLELHELRARLTGQRVHAVAGIGDPRRFFAMLAEHGFDCVEHPFPDHHAYTRQDLDFGAGAVLTTEKDAVKFFPFTGELALSIWVVPIDAEFEPDLAAFVLEKLDGRPPT